MIRLATLVLALGGLFALSAQGQDDGQVYRIKNRLTDKVLAPDESGNALVQRSPKAKDESAHWKLVKSKDGNFFLIVNVGSGKALTAPNKDALAQIALEAPNKGEKAKVGQLWSFEKRDKAFTVQSRFSGFYLDVFNFEKDDGVKIIQQELNEKGTRGNQIWELVPVKGK